MGRADRVEAWLCAVVCQAEAAITEPVLGAVQVASLRVATGHAARLAWLGRVGAQQASQLCVVDGVDLTEIAGRLTARRWLAVVRAIVEGLVNFAQAVAAHGAAVFRAGPRLAASAEPVATDRRTVSGAGSLFKEHVAASISAYDGALLGVVRRRRASASFTNLSAGAVRRGLAAWALRHVAFSGILAAARERQ